MTNPYQINGRIYGEIEEVYILLQISNVSPKTMSILGVHSLKFKAVSVYNAKICTHLGIKRIECDLTSNRTYTNKNTNNPHIIDSRLS